MYVKTKITRHDIRNAECADAEKCIVARAINKCLKPGYRSSVIGPAFDIVPNLVKSFDPDDSVYSGNVSEKICKLISKFDNEATIKPQEICVSIPKKFLKASLTKGN